MYRNLICSCFGLVLLACSAEEKEVAPKATMQMTPAEEETALFAGETLDAAVFDHYGDGVHQGEAIDIAAVLADPRAHAGQPLRVRGPIFAVCKSKGCWVLVGSEEQKVRALFKDGGFVLPKDCSGEILMEGMLEVEEISVEDQKRFLESEGKAEEAAKITEPELKLKFMAYGVALPKKGV